jgi:hypothetical protein
MECPESGAGVVEGISAGISRIEDGISENPAGKSVSIGDSVITYIRPFSEHVGFTMNK